MTAASKLIQIDPELARDVGQRGPIAGIGGGSLTDPIRDHKFFCNVTEEFECGEREENRLPPTMLAEHDGLGFDPVDAESRQMR